MCFRPSAIVANESQVQYGECPTCGSQVAANAGVSNGTCPYCGNAIPAKSSTDTINHSSRDVKIL